MSLKSNVRPRTWLAGGAALLAAATVSLVLTGGDAGAVDQASSTSAAPAAAAPAAAQAPDPKLYPFGAPTGNGDYKVPPPPGAPTLVPTIGTKTTQRLYGSSPFEEAVSVTQHIWPAALPENTPGQSYTPDRPWALTC
jgi:hypothetical protein